ncbi:MAG: hypothetical protein JXM70_30490 [Pirellulales bacterium]|nr:hypothetical protein [Pirellulales bacterium]
MFLRTTLFIPFFLYIIFPLYASESTAANRWEPAIKKFETLDRKNPPQKEGILFIGSSSIRMWDLDKSFPKLPVINRGFGGSHIADSIHFADRIIFPYRPKTIVLYAGDNDLAAGKSVATVVADYRRFVKTVQAKLPRTRILFVAIKPSIARWKLIDKIRAANKQIQAETEKDKRLLFVDIDAPMIGPDGKPKADLFKKDGLHLNAKGYKLWNKIVGPLLVECVHDAPE